MKSREPLLMVVSGIPGSGKSTLSKRIASRLSVPYICRDDIKEILFDTLGWSDRERSRELGRSSYELFFWTIAKVMETRVSFLAETAFHTEGASPRVDSLIRDGGYRVCQIHCDAPDDTIAQRTVERFAKGERHPGHGNMQVEASDVSEARVLRTYDPLDLQGELIRVNSSSEETIRFETLVARLAKLMQAL